MKNSLNFAERLAQKAGEIMLDNFTLAMKKDWKEDDSPLTRADTDINDLIIQEISRQYPSHSILAEEESQHESDREYVWVCDPVDGTIPFSHGVPTCAFSLALTHNGESIVGVIYDPFLKRLVSAEKGTGAMLNGNPIRVSASKTLKHALVSIDGPNRDQAILSLLPKKLIERKASYTKFASIVYGGLLVAIGEYAAVVTQAPTPWDIAALKVIIEEAGGRVTDLHGNEQRYDREINGAVISNGHVHEELMGLVRM